MAKALKKMTMDGNTATAHASYAFTEVAGIYPITPSSNMAEFTDEWAAHGRKNIFGQTVSVIEMQSEAGAAGTMHGSLQAGALTTSYTASQGLLLMIPNMYKMAGELLPGVLHVSARAVAGHALSIFGDHSDVMACRQTGFAMLSAANVQEAMDMAAVAHLAAIKGRVPFLHFFDGFRTSHEVQKIEVLEYEDLAKLVDHDAIDAFRKRALNPDRPELRGTAQNPDIFFQAKESSNAYYDALPAVVEEYMGEINKLTGRDYKLFNYYGAADAERVIVSMGSSCDAIEEVIDYLMAKGEKVGLVKVHLYRPFVEEKLLAAFPKSVKKIAVLDRCKEPGAPGEPLYLDVCSAFFNAEMNDKPYITGGRYGLGSKDVTPAQMLAVFEHLKGDKPRKEFTVGIIDDLTNLSLPVGDEIDVTAEGTISCKFWGIGGDGTVGANKNSITIIGDYTDMYAQAYFGYDSKKSSGVTVNHLRFGKKPIRSTYFVKKAGFVACHHPSYVNKYDMLTDLDSGGTFLLNCPWSEAELSEHLPGEMKKYLADNNINFYIMDATKIARELNLGNRINTVLQSAFFKLADIIPIDDAVKYMKDANEKTYGKRGEKVVQMNNLAVDAGADPKNVTKIAVPADWANAKATVQTKLEVVDELTDFVENVARPINALKGELLPTSTFKGREDGTFPQGTSAFEKRGVAVEVPEWIAENCIQCNQCSYVCPHASIRPFLLNKEEADKAPKGYKSVTGMKGYEEYQYSIQVDTLDCYGCENCANLCPAAKTPKGTALVMKPIESQMKEMDNWYYSLKLSEKANPLDKHTVKGSQFEMPYLEFSGACMGCGETPYAKLITQLYGDRMYIANATGCSSIWGGSAPSTPFCKNKKGQGPVWANSLFEDNAEFGYGMFMGLKKIRERMHMELENLANMVSCDKTKNAVNKWVETMHHGENNKGATLELVAALEDLNASGEAAEIKQRVLKDKEYLSKKSVWCFGGDGWAYDIGFGGLDHVIASGEDVNLLVMDTEVYSNTGGQSSKATPTGAIAKFAAAGKQIRKKDLGMIAMSYGYVYVAQIGMGANQNQAIKAIIEAESYPGPSIVIAYAPCISHGIAMNDTQQKTKDAVEAGYWHLYRYNPLLEDEGKNPFVLDSKEPTMSFQDFIDSETRYSSLKMAFPKEAGELFKQAEVDSKKRYAAYKRLAEAKY
ncbi:MAG: pyruvate:ferredoxin (flavodoxin) oxidoreductase [Defluviitaleaceae bacterium]|nr:pyruvate:ferredoxin (flavodoxin) oxidoreductase [Defluviitaleaceae bacterium]